MLLLRITSRVCLSTTAVQKRKIFYPKCWVNVKVTCTLGSRVFCDREKWTVHVNSSQASVSKGSCIPVWESTDVSLRPSWIRPFAEIAGVGWCTEHSFSRNIKTLPQTLKPRRPLSISGIVPQLNCRKLLRLIMPREENVTKEFSWFALINEVKKGAFYFKSCHRWFSLYSHFALKLLFFSFTPEAGRDAAGA